MTFEQLQTIAQAAEDARRYASDANITQVHHTSASSWCTGQSEISTHDRARQAEARLTEALIQYYIERGFGDRETIDAFGAHLRRLS